MLDRKRKVYPLILIIWIRLFIRKAFHHLILRDNPPTYDQLFSPNN